mmetsp:Transcript_14349/g.36663  ORF Transcript_14349/g.36663 Transcript_14349/m.36663 type:complete len:378 (+) Transcript_14349:3-1136(+)
MLDPETQTPSRRRLMGFSSMPLLMPTRAIAIASLVFVLLLLIPATEAQAHPSPAASPATSPPSAAADPASSMVATACMPSVARPGGASYVAATVRSFLEKTAASESITKLVVFNMDEDPARHAELNDLARELAGHPRVEFRMNRTTEVVAPRKQTHGDSLERVRWRSKEAMDYSDVLERCLEESDTDFVIMLQDDLDFDEDFATSLEWLDVNLLQNKQFSGTWCTVSLFDPEFVHEKKGRRPYLRKLKNSNMQARVFSRLGGAAFASFIKSYFDESPVDWLCDHFCKAVKRITWVKVPLVVQHVGSVSSFEGNRQRGKGQGILEENHGKDGSAGSDGEPEGGDGNEESGAEATPSGAVTASPENAASESGANEKEEL